MLNLFRAGGSPRPAPRLVGRIAAGLLAAGLAAVGLAAVGLAVAAAAEEAGSLPVGRYADFARADTEASFLGGSADPALARWIGSTTDRRAELRSANRAEGFATLYMPASRTTLNVPLGWYAIDDGERGAIFPSDETVRVILRPIDLAFEGVADIQGYAALKRAMLMQRYPRARFEERRLAPDMVMNVYRGIPARPNDKAPREIYDIVTASPTDKGRANLLTFGVPEGQGDRYMPLLGLMLKDRRIDW